MKLTYKDLILVALLSGGDYHPGIEGCGPSAAVALARAGFGAQLVDKIESLALSVQRIENKPTKIKLGDREKRELDTFLEHWRADMVNELRNNSHGFLKRKNTRAANNLQSMGASFPDVNLLMAYINPVTSEERAVARAVKADPTASGAALMTLVHRAKEDIAQQLRESIVWQRDPSVGAIAKVCEDYFEWGYKERIVHRFGSWLWEGIICRMLRRKTMISDSSEYSFTHAHACTNFRSDGHGVIGNGEESLETSTRALILKITSTRTHATTDHLLEYRLEIDPRLLICAAENGIEGRRSAPTTGWTDDDDEEDVEDRGKKKGKTVDPNAPARYWLPAIMVERGQPALVSSFKDAERLKEEKRAARGTGRGRGRGTARARKNTRPSESEGEGLDHLSSSAFSTPNVTPRKARPLRPTQNTPLVQPPANVSSKGVNDFFTVSKTTIPNNIRKEKVAGSSTSSTSYGALAKGKEKARAGVSTNTSRVASLFEDQEITIFKDLTQVKKRRGKDSSYSSAARSAQAFKDVPSQDTENEATQDAPRGGSSRRSSMRSATNLPHRDPEVNSPSIPEAGPSKPSTFFAGTDRMSTWKAAAFPMDDHSIPLRPDSPPLVNHQPDEASPSQRRTRRSSSPLSFGDTVRSERLQKSPRKSKKQVSPRLSSVSPSRHSSKDQDDALEPLEPLRLVPKMKPAPRRAVMKDIPRVSRARVIEISSDSDSAPPPKLKTLNSTFTVRKRTAMSNAPKHRNPPPPQADIEVIDLCSD